MPVIDLILPQTYCTILTIYIFLDGSANYLVELASSWSRQRGQALLEKYLLLRCITALYL